jgi:hypothetical protein
MDGSDESDATCTNYDCTIGVGRSRCPSGVGCVDHFALCDGIPGNGLSCKDTGRIHIGRIHIGLFQAANRTSCRVCTEIFYSTFSKWNVSASLV